MILADSRMALRRLTPSSHSQLGQKFFLSASAKAQFTVPFLVSGMEDRKPQNPAPDFTFLWSSDAFKDPFASILWFS